MKRIKNTEDTEEQNSGDEQGKLRRWVSNLQLESWQLELLITGFSIFLLASSLEEYESFKDAIVYDRLTSGSNTSNPLFPMAGRFLLESIPWALRFFLINLLVHLLLRGFWIGIVGLSSVSSVIDIDGLNLKGKFRRYMPEKVRSLDELIVFLDKASSVIFAYTYLLVFSILSVVIIFMITLGLLGLIIIISSLSIDSSVFLVLNLITVVFVIFFIICAILFFIDSLFFSTFKKSRWFSTLFYPIYRVFSVLSLSFIYRSIYYHLITNYKKKQIITVNVILILLFVAWTNFNDWNLHKFYPEENGGSELIMGNHFYDDERGAEYVHNVSIPSKFVKTGFLELFIHYDPKYNTVMSFRCPEGEQLNRHISFSETVRVGFEAGKDSTKTIEDLLPERRDYGVKVKEVLACLSQLFRIEVDGKVIENPPFSYYTHPSRGEKGFLVMLDVEHLPRGAHSLKIEFLRSTHNPVAEKVSEDKLKFGAIARLPFWVM